MEATAGWRKWHTNEKIRNLNLRQILTGKSNQGCDTGICSTHGRCGKCVQILAGNSYGKSHWPDLKETVCKVGDCVCLTIETNSELS
jgi:hypothetical protein